jgi:hypothetical protein
MSDGLLRDEVVVRQEIVVQRLFEFEYSAFDFRTRILGGFGLIFGRGIFRRFQAGRAAARMVFR